MKRIFTLCSIIAALVFFVNVQSASAVDFSGKITSVNKGTLTEGTAYVMEGEEIILTVELSALGLKQNLNLSAVQPAQYVANPADIKKIDPATIAAAEADNAIITITLKPSTLGQLLYCIQPGTTELEGYYLWLNVTVEPNTAGTLSSFLLAHPNGTEGVSTKIEGDFVVTHIWEQPYDGWSQKRAYLQDASAGVFVHYYEPLTCKVGDHYDKIRGVLHINLDQYSQGVFGIEGTEAYPLPKTPTATNAPATPSPITLAEVAQHHGRLVSISGVQFDETGTFTEADTVAVTIGETQLHVCLFPGSDLVGTAIPAEADLVCIVRSVGEGKVMLSPRSKADVTAKNNATALETVAEDVWATKVLENGQLYIIRDGVRYNIFGTKQ